MKNQKRDALKIVLKIPVEHAERLEKFLSDKGFSVEDAFPVMIEYGLDCLDPDELKKINEEKELEQAKIGKSYPTLRFKTYQYFMDNQAMTMQLRIMLTENRRLKEMIRDSGLEQVPKSEWDRWGEEEIKRLYEKYVFTKRN